MKLEKFVVKPVRTGSRTATEPNTTGCIRFGCSPPVVGNGLDRLRSPVAPLGVEKPDLTGP